MAKILSMTDIGSAPYTALTRDARSRAAFALLPFMARGQGEDMDKDKPWSSSPRKLSRACSISLELKDTLRPTTGRGLAELTELDGAVDVLDTGGMLPLLEELLYQETMDRILLDFKIIDFGETQ